MKAKPVLVSVVLLAAVCLAGCISKTGTGTGDAFVRPNTSPDIVVAKAPIQKPAAQQAATGR